MGKGKLGPDGWAISERATSTEGTSAEVNAANNTLVKENTLLREELAQLRDEQIELLSYRASASAAKRVESIVTALEILDPDNDTLWTAEGLPRVEVVAAIMGDDSITREAIETAAPGFIRPATPSV